MKMMKMENMNKEDKMFNVINNDFKKNVIYINNIKIISLFN